MTNELKLSHGEMVAEGKVAVSDFLLQVIAKSDENKLYSGTLSELEALVQTNFENFEPGSGAVDADVRLVHVPTNNFYTNIVPITEDNVDSVRVKWKPRVEGEAPVAKLVIVSDERIPAAVVKIVIYRADVLARDSGRSSDAEWEIVAILSQPKADVPMHPTTMTRNALHQLGGTFREYSSRDWAESELFWAQHAYLESPKVATP